MKDMEWSPSESIRLVKEYHARPELWDSKHPRYRVASLKHMRWMELAETLGVELGEVRKRLNSVLASHRRELKRVREGGISGWYLYEFLNFLPSHIDNNDPRALLDEPCRRSPSASPQPETQPVPAAASQPKKPKKPRHPIREVQPSSCSDEEEEAGEYLDFDDSDNARPGPPAELSIKTEPDVKRRLPVASSYRRKIKLKAKLTKPMKTFASKLQVLRPRPEYARKKDECDSFGEYIADSLRKHDERTQSMIKQAINNIIFEQEMKKYSHQFIIPEHHNPLILGDDEGEE